MFLAELILALENLDGSFPVKLDMPDTPETAVMIEFLFY
jgi:hypothetical protein